MLQIKFIKFGTASFKSMFFLLATVFVLTSIPHEAWSKGKKVNNSDAVTALTSCMLASDSSHKNLKDGSYACCSKSEGFCIWCPVSPEKPCVKKPTKIVTTDEIPPLITVVNPAFFKELTGDAGPDESNMSPVKNFILRSKGETAGTEKYHSDK